jgi:hypothetical protein
VQAGVRGRVFLMEEHYTIRQHSMPFILNSLSYAFFFGVSQYTSDIVVPYCTNSTISTFFLSQKTGAISFMTGRRFI